jgi:chondroitin AC lyase
MSHWKVRCTAASLLATILLGAATTLSKAQGATMPTTDLTTVKQRICDSVLSARDKKKITDQARTNMTSLGPNGTWKEVNYKDKTQSSWGPVGHLKRLIDMAVAYRRPKNALAGNAALKAAILKALDHWLVKDYHNSNWWWEQIGVPMRIGKVLVLMEKDLTPRQLAAGVKIMKRSKIGRTGQNLVWLASNQAVWACLVGDDKAAAFAFKRIWQEIRIVPGAGEGVKADCSFWQHDRCFYSGGYGLDFSRDSANFAWLARGTRFAAPPSKVKIISAYLLDGQQWMVRGGTFDYSSTGRALSRPYWGPGQFLWLVGACRQMIEVDAERRAELTAFLDRLENGPAKAKVPFSGNRHFWKSDFMTHHRKDWYASAHMYSTRIDNTDFPHMGEGRLNHHIADGVTFVMRRGDEYEHIFPVWNWRRLPGITSEQDGPQGKVRVSGRRSFVGGVSDGEFGLAVMDFARGKLRLKKSWFFFDREFVALGAGITCDSDNQVVTSVNQCHLKSEVLGGGKKLPKGTHKLAGPTWAHHDGVGYLFPEKTAATLRAGKQTGSWYRIHPASPKTKVELEVFSLWIDHGKKPKGARYAYIVAPGVATKEMPAYARDPGVEVLRNTTSLQAVQHKKLRILAAAFYKPGKLSTTEGLTVSVDQPCLLLLREDKKGLRASLSNPRNQKLTVNLTVAHKGAAAVERKFDLPGGEKAGSSLNVELNREILVD